jgi:hypothetical protein
VIGSSPGRRARAAGALRIVLATAALAGCAETMTGPRGGSGPRGAADDGDLWNLAPATTDVIVDVDLGLLRASPWSSSLLAGDLGGEREERKRMFGYDVFTDAERMLVTASEIAGVPHNLTIARGRFDAPRVGAAFGGATPGSTATRWRDSPLWEGGGKAVALVTPRTLVEGAPDEVRAAIDAAWGIVPDAGGGPLGELRRTLDADRNPPAVFLALTVTDPMRDRATGFLDLPRELRRAAARLNLGADLDLDAVAVFDEGHAAAAAASTWSQAARLLGRQRMLALLGLGPVFEGLTLGAEGARVHGHLHIPAEKREGLADKLLAVLQLVANARGSTP